MVHLVQKKTNKKMPSVDNFITCKSCPRTILFRSGECVHCFSSFCSECLVKHHHKDVKHEFEELIQKIDMILEKFRYHAHSQTEWTNHLMNDQQKLKNFVQMIDASPKQYIVFNIPKFQWVFHVQQLIEKNDYAIHETCDDILYPKKTSAFM